MWLIRKYSRTEKKLLRYIFKPASHNYFLNIYLVTFPAFTHINTRKYSLRLSINLMEILVINNTKRTTNIFIIIVISSAVKRSQSVLTHWRRFSSSDSTWLGFPCPLSSLIKWIKYKILKSETKQNIGSSAWAESRVRRHFHLHWRPRVVLNVVTSQAVTLSFHAAWFKLMFKI